MAVKERRKVEYQDGRVRRTVAMLPEDYERLRAVAKAEGRSMAYQMGTLLSCALDRWEESNGSASQRPGLK